jgi:3',5'-cyclic AMP phosphodiesterase CpdA
MSAKGLVEKLRITKNLYIAWRKERAVSSYNPEILEALAEFIYENAKSKLDEHGSEITEEGKDKLDAVLITGDLATTGTRDDIKRVLKFLRAKFNPKSPYKSTDTDYTGGTLSAVKIPVFYLPGNHDRYVPTLKRHRRVLPIFFMPGGREFDQLLLGNNRDPVRRIELSTKPSNEKRLRIVILAADFSLEHFNDREGFYGWLAQGKAYSNIRRHLRVETERLRKQKTEDENLCVLWAIHFPPEYPGRPKYGKLLGDDKLINAANRAGVDAVLAGHTHEQLTYSNPSMSFEVFCCGTTTQYEPLTMPTERDALDVKKGNLFQIITVSADEAGRVKVSARDYRYSNPRESRRLRRIPWVEVPSSAPSLP